MKHRQAENPGTSLSVAEMEAVLEGGVDAEIMAMMKKLRRLPSSEMADRALAAAERSSVYGWRHAVPQCIALWREGDGWQQTPPNLPAEVLRTDGDGMPAEALGRIPLETGRFPGVMTTLGESGLVRTSVQEIGRQEEFALLPLAEKIRFAAARILVANSLKDFRKIAARAMALGLERSIAALAELDAGYAVVDRRGRVRPISPAMQLVRQMCEPRPFEFAGGASGEAAGGREELAVCRELGLMLADTLFSPACSLERRLREIEAERVVSCPPPSIPPYPAETHNAQVSEENSLVVVRKKTSFSSRGEIDNPLGPAIVTHGGERYALKGRFLSKAAWEREVATARPENDANVPLAKSPKAPASGK